MHLRGLELMINYREIKKEDKDDLQLPNEPFEIIGQLEVTRIDNKWRMETKINKEVEIMCFPDEDYTYDDIVKKGFAIGAYDGLKCVGLAIYEYNGNKNLYLMDLKVSSEYRNHGVATHLIEMGRDYGKHLDYRGIYTIAQDNNLIACQFYLKNNFVVGGLNTMDYRYTSQHEKADVYFYLQFR